MFQVLCLIYAGLKKIKKFAVTLHMVMILKKFCSHFYSAEYSIRIRLKQIKTVTKFPLLQILWHMKKIPPWFQVIHLPICMINKFFLHLLLHQNHHHNLVYQNCIAFTWKTNLHQFVWVNSCSLIIDETLTLTGTRPGENCWLCRPMWNLIGPGVPGVEPGLVGLSLWLLELLK